MGFTLNTYVAKRFRIRAMKVFLPKRSEVARVAFTMSTASRVNVVGA